MGRSPSSFAPGACHQGVSIQLVSPASGESRTPGNAVRWGGKVSIQLVSPASGEEWKLPARHGRTGAKKGHGVSIQLVSPASGEASTPVRNPLPCWSTCFHSISFPSEWGVKQLMYRARGRVKGFHSISFPSEWGG